MKLKMFGYKHCYSVTDFA